jgi:hypothetical protein
MSDLILLTRPLRASRSLRGPTELLSTTVKALRPRPKPRGPESVAASLARGLGTLGLSFELNPRRFGREGVVGVLADLGALEQAVDWRRRDGRRRLVAGPNLVVLPSDARSLMTAPEIDLCVVPSEWVKQLYEDDAPELRGRIAVWPAGVDPQYWLPVVAPTAGPRRALVYVKQLAGHLNVSNDDVRAAVAVLTRAGFAATTLHYGEFDHRDYLGLLQGVEVLVFFSPTESQGLALVEAWATDVPTLVWAQGQLEYKGRRYTTSSAPYLSPQTGETFVDAAGLEQLVAGWELLRRQFAPRDWVLDQMTDARCAQAYWDLAHPRSGGFGRYSPSA